MANSTIMGFFNAADNAWYAYWSAGGMVMGSATMPIPSGSAPMYAARAWVNFDGTTNTGGNCTIRASGNVSSITDNGTGNYTVNFTTAMPDANYAVSGICGPILIGDADRTINLGNNSAQSTTSVNIFVKTGSAQNDRQQVHIIVHR
jgi:hypothetical protein